MYSVINYEELAENNETYLNKNTENSNNILCSYYSYFKGVKVLDMENPNVTFICNAKWNNVQANNPEIVNKKLINENVNTKFIRSCKLSTTES